MKLIKLGGKNGGHAIVDNENFEYLNQFRWWTTRGYAVRRAYISRKVDRDAKRENIMMHKLIMKTPKGMFVDHINRNKLDNRRENLRICTRTQNNVNTEKNRNKTGFRGVYFRTTHRGIKPFQALISLKNKKSFIGSFQTAEEAAKAYDEIALKHHGEFAITNFPKENYI